MSGAKNFRHGGKRGLAAGAGLGLLGALLGGKAHAQQTGQPNDFIRIDAVETIRSFEILADGTLKVTLSDGRVVVLAADDFVVTNGVTFIDVPALTEAMNAGVAAAGTGGNPLLLPLLAAGGAGVAAAAGGGGGGDSGPPSPPPPPPPTNQAPTFSSSNVAVSRDEGASTTAVTASATDPDGNTLTYSISGTDAALFDINPSTGVVTFKAAPDFEAPGDSDHNNTYTFTVNASDGSATANQTVTITVTNVNDNPPVFTSGGAVSVAENTTAAYTATTTDADGSTVTYSISGADAALFDIDSATGAVTFKNAPDFEAPADADANNVYSIVVTASDGANFANQTVTITVTNVNDNSPVFTSGGLSTIAENTAAAYTAAATDADGSTLTYSISGADAGLFDIDSTTGAVTFKNAPDFEAPTDAGANNVYDIIVSANDGVATTNQAVAITVTNVNDVAPVFTSGGAVGVDENQTAAYTAVATDVDTQSLVYSLSGADAALFDIDATTGVVVFKTPPDFEAPLDADGNNVYDIVVSASDGVASAARSVAITVQNLNDAGPTVTSPAGASVAENSTAAYTITATDPDGSTLAYSISGADAALFDIDSATGAVTFKNAPDFEAPADADANNVYSIVVTASDGANFANQTVTITVTNVNDNSPVFTSGGLSTIAENTAAAYTAAATDADGSTLTYSISGADAGLFDIDSTTGAVTFKNAPDFEAPTDAGANNVYDIIVSANDGVATTNQAVAITVTNVNDVAPVFTSGGAVGVDENQTAAYTAVATDVDTQSLVYSLSGADAALFDIDATTGVVVFKTPPDFEAPLDADGNNVYDITVTANDGVATTDQAVAITVTNVNDNAPIVADSIIATNQDAEITGSLSATDADGDTLTFATASGPQHGTLVLQSNGTYAYTPDEGYSGQDSFTFNVSDGHGSVSSGSASIGVANGRTQVTYFDPATLSIVNEPSTNGAVHEGQSAHARVIALDDGGHLVTWAQFSAPGSTDGSWGIYTRRYDSNGQEVGGPILVNTTTTFDQYVPSAASLADGGYVIVWDSAQQDGSGWGIYAQRYDASGAKVGGEEQLVNITTEGDQREPSVSALGTGYVVTWNSADSDIHARVFLSDGTPLTGEFIVNENTTGVQYNFGFVTQTVTQLAGGKFAITWTDQSGQDGSTDGVYVRIFNSDGTPVSGQILVNTTTIGQQSHGSIGALADGGFVVTWSDPTGIADPGWGVFAQRFDANGVKVGGEFQPSTFTSNTEFFSKVQQLADGGFVIVWQSNSSSQSGYYDLAGQRYDANGVKVGGEFVVNATNSSHEEFPSIALRDDGALLIVWRGQDGQAIEQKIIEDFDQDTAPADFEAGHQVNPPITGEQQRPDVAALPDGGHVIAWMASSGTNPDNSGYGVYVQRYDSAGQAIGGPALVNTTTADSQQFPSVDALAGGGYVVVWQSENQDGAAWGVYAQRFDASGAKVGGEQLVNVTTSGNQLEPTVAALGTGYVVTWTDINDVYARVFAADGTPLTGEFVVNEITSGDQYAYGSVADSVTALADGKFAITWTDQSGQDGSGYGVYVRVFNANGTPAGGQILANTTTNLDQYYGSIGALAGGGFVVTWSDLFSADGSSWGVFAQRFDENGAKVGDQFQVNTLSFNTQIYSKVEQLANGGFVIIWQSNATSGADLYDIAGQRYDADGERVGGEFIVNSANGWQDEFPSVALRQDGALVVTWRGLNGLSIEQKIVDNFAEDTQPVTENLNQPILGAQNVPDVAALVGGGHVVVWMASSVSNPDAADFGIYAQLYDDAGQKVGNPVLVNTTTDNGQYWPAVDGLAGGGYVIVWQSQLQDGSGWGVYSQRFDALGAKVGGEELVTVTTDGNQHEPSVSALGTGYVVAWTGETDIYVRVFAADGTPLTGDILANENTFGLQTTFSSFSETTAALSDGKFAVTWVDETGSDGSGSSVHVRVFNANGTPASGEILVNTTTIGNQHYGSIGALASGGFVVSWSDEHGGDGSSWGVYAQRFDANGVKVGGEFLVNTYTHDAQLASKVEQLADGGFVIVWQGPHESGQIDITGQRYNANGVKVGGEFVINNPNYWNEGVISVALRADGALIAVWRGQNGQAIEQEIITNFAADGAEAKTLVGGAGPDSLMGWDKTDTLDGAAGNDRIAGLGGADQLTGGAGADTFVYFDPAEGGDIITDFQSGQDRIEISASGFGGGLVAGGPVTLIAGAAPTATGSAGLFLYDTATGQVFWDIDGAGASAAVLLASLQGAPALAASDFVVTGIAATGGLTPPILIDLEDDGFGFQLALFDFDSDGVQEYGSWPAGDAILALDRNGDGQVTSGVEISFLRDTPGAMTDLEGLRAFDSNSDGVLSAADDRWSDFLVWNDDNSNGASDLGELRSLSGASTASLSLSRNGEASTDAHGNVIHGYADVEMLDGVTRRAADVSLRCEEAGANGVNDLGVIRAGSGVESAAQRETLADGAPGPGTNSYGFGLESVQRKDVHIAAADADQVADAPTVDPFNSRFGETADHATISPGDDWA